MKKQHSHSRKSRFARVSLVLTVLVLTVTVLLNVVATTLARRYGWYTSMVGEYSFTTTERAYDILEGALAARKDASKKLEIIFCDVKKNLLASENMRPMYETAMDLQARFPEQIEIRCHDVIVNPDAIRPYQTVTDPITGEEKYTPLDNTSVLVVYGDRAESRTVYDFYSYKEGNPETVWAYKGERSLIGMSLRVLNETSPSVVLTTNHGESFYDNELMMLLEDAGYTFRSLDLYREEIPADCDLLITFSPNADFTVDDGVAEVSEIAKVEAYLAKGGNTFLAMLDSSTPHLANLEGFLADWGIATRYHKNPVTGMEERYAVRDESNSLTADGYTVFGQPTESAVAAGFSAADAGVGVVFSQATALKVASGYQPQGNHVYSKGTRTMYGLYVGSETAESWASGAPVNGETPLMMAVTEEKSADASSYVGVCASTAWASEEYLQTAVYGNPAALVKLCERIGLGESISTLSLQPMQLTSISSITTAQMWRWTLGLALVPPLVIAGVAVLLLTRRRRA